MVSATALREKATFIEWPLRLVLCEECSGRILPSVQSLLIRPEASGKAKSFSPCVPDIGARTLDIGPGRVCAWRAGQTSMGGRPSSQPAYPEALGLPPDMLE